MLKQNTVNEGKNETFVFLDLEIEKNFKCALDLFPDARNIFIMSGNSDLDKAFLSLYKFVLKDYKDKYIFNYLSGLTISELIDKLNNLPGKSLVFASSYQKDTKGVSYYNTEVMKMIFEHARAPIFQLFYAAFEGSIGGLLINSSLIGEKLGEISVRLLNGESPDSIGTYHGNFSDYIFDAKQLKKWKISEKSLPEGSIVLNKEYSFFEENFTLIIAGFIFLILETILLIFLISFYGKQKKQSIIIKEQEDRYLRLVDFNRLSELSELTASLSHQLKQPLTAILCNSQALLRFINNNKFEKELSIEILGNIVGNVKTASEIITSLRGMMKKEILEKKQVNINQIAKNVLILTNSQTTDNNIIVESKFDEKEPYIYADPMLIEQVILNLMENAIDEMEYKTNGQKKIIIMTEMQDGSVNLSVMDNGNGIPDSLEKIIFRPFFSTKSDGLGIGLTLCKSIIEEHDGKIKFENNASGGVTFSFKLKTVK
jgi:signal transduction histidine kinase